MRRNTLSLTLLFVTLALSLVAAAEVARPANAVTTNVNPPKIATTGDASVYQSSYQNPGFYAQGRYWVFYEDSSSTCEHQAGCLFYVWSANGATLWSTPVSVGVHVTDNDWSVVTDGTFAYYARYNETSFDFTANRALLFGMGQLGSNGLIAWQPEQVVLNPSSSMKFPNDVIGVDSNGLVWVGYQQDNSGSRTPRIIHSNSTLPPPPLSTSFIVNASDPTILRNVMFNGTATGGNWGGTSGYTFSWNFGDNSTAKGQSVTHVYSSPGNYTVTLNTLDNGNPQQTASSAQTVPVSLLLLSTNTPPSLQVPASKSVKTGTAVSFSVTSSDSDRDTVALSSSSLPLGASFNPLTGQFTWTPTSDQANQFWPMSFTATDNASLSVTKQVLIYVSPLWSGDFLLSNSGNGNWHVDIATLPTGGQVYAAYWVEGNPIFGRLFSNTAWGVEENLWGPSSPPSTDVNSFIFATGSTVSAIYYDTNVGKLYSSSRGPSGGWGSNVISPGDAKSAGTLGRYSLPFTAAFDQGDSRFYVFWYNQANSTIDEFSGADITWLKTEAAFSTHTSAAGSTLGSYHYSTSVGGKNTFGIMWIDGNSSPYNLNFGLESVGPPGSPTTDGSWNPKVSCTASVVTIEQILGSQSNSFGGATESGSVFNPGILAPSPGDAKRWLTTGPNTPPGWVPNGPPCTIANADGQGPSAFVEIDGIQRGYLLNEDYSAVFDPVNGGGFHPNGMNTSDTTFNIYTPGFNNANSIGCSSTNTTGCMHTIHVEFDHDWKAAGYCGPNTVCDPYQMAVGPVSSQIDKTLLDVQGFIYWDPDHANDATHSYSGWEIHPLTAWRLHGISPSFSLSASPKTVTTLPSKAVNSTITINTSNLFSGPVPLTASVTPSGPASPTVTFHPSTVIVPPCNLCGIANSTLTVTPTSTSSGNYVVTVTGSNGSTTRSTNVTVQVQGFILSANPQTVTVSANASVNSTITVTSLGSFSGPVNLSATATGCACGFVTKITPSTVTLSIGGKQNATLIITAGALTGSAVITVTGTSSTLSASTTVSVTAVDFTISASPTSSAVLTNTLANSTITVIAINGFTGTVSLTDTVPTGLTCSLNPVSITLTSITTSGTSSLACSGPVGNYTVILTGTSNTLSHSALFTIRVQDFTIAASPAGLMVNVGSSGVSTIRVTAVNGFAGIVGLSQNGGTACGLSAPSVTLTSSITSATVSLTCTITTIGNNAVLLASTSGPLAHSATITFQVVDFTISASPTSLTVNAGSLGNSTITLGSLNGFNRTVTMSISTQSGLTCSIFPNKITLILSPASSVLSCHSLTANDYTVIVTGTNGTLSHATTVITFHIVDFTATPNISTLTLFVGQESQAPSVHFASLNGFAGTLTINVVVTPSGPTGTPLFPSLRLISGSNSTGIDVKPGSVAGVYVLNITGTNGQLTHSAIITLIVQDFKILPSPSIVTVLTGTAGTSTITVSGLNGFSGNVAVSNAVSPLAGLTCNLSPFSITLSATVTNVNSTLTCSGTVGSYVVTITGSSNGITHTTTVTYRVQDFTVSANPVSVTVFLGNSATSTLTVTGLQGFTGTVALTDTVSPTIGLSCVLNPASFAFNTTTTSRTSSLSCADSAAAGSFNVTVTGTGSGLSRSVSIKFTVGTAFTVTANPSSVAVVVGSSGTTTVSVTYSPIFLGTVTLNDTVSPSAGLSCTLSVTTFTASGNSTLSCSGSAGQYTVTVNGASGANTASTTVIYRVQDFTISANPSTVTVNAGVAGTSTITVTALNGFSGIVNIAPSISPATGLTCTVTPPSVTGSGTSTLSCFGIAGIYTVTVTGSSGTLVHFGTVTLTVQDFTIVAGPTSATILAGASGTSTITVTALDGFAGVVSLTSSISPVTGLTCALTPTSVTGSGTSTLSCNGSAGSYTVTVTGTSGALSRSATVTYTIQDFTIAASPTAVNVLAGTAGTSTISVTALQGFSGVVGLASTISPVTGLTCSLTPTSVTGSGTSTLACNGSAGSYSVTVTGTSSTLSHSATVSYTVQDFTISASPTSVTINAGPAGTSTITITALQGFNGVVSLTPSISPASGLTCTLTPTGVTGSGTSTLTCNGSAGTYIVTITGTSGSLSHGATVTYTVRDFTLASAPTGLTVNAGVAGNSTITVGPVNGFTGTVALASSISPATGLTCTLTPGSITLGASQASVLSCSGSAGTYTVTTTGTSGSLTHTVTVSYTIQDFTIAANPTTVTVTAGVAGTSTITITGEAGFSAVVSLAASISPANTLTCTLTPTSVTGSGTSTLSCTGSAAVYTVTVTGTSGTLSHSATVTYMVQDFIVTANPTALSFPSGGSGNSAITVASRDGFTGTVTLTTAISPSVGLTCNLSSTSITLSSGGTGASTLSCNSTTPGAFTVTVTGTGSGLTTAANVSVNSGAAYTVAASPTAVTVLAGATGTSTITVTAQSGFTGTVNLVSSVSPITGLNCNLSPTSITLGTSGTSALSCSGSSGIYTVTVTGTNGPNSVSATVSFTSQDFTVVANPTSVPVIAGVSGISTVTISGLQGFSGVVSLSAVVSPSTGLACALAPTSVAISGTSTLSCSGSAGAFSVTVTGTSSTLSHSAIVSYAVQDFAVAASPTSVSTNAGTAGTSTVTVTALQGFGGVVSLSATVFPSTGLGCTLTPTSVTGSGSSTLSCTGNAGSYNVTVTGTSSSLSHSATISYTEKDFTITANPTSVTFVAGSSGASTITVLPVSGFTGTVLLSATLSPTTGLTCTLSPTSLTMGASGASTLSCSGSAGSYTVTVAGSSGGLSHSVAVIYSTQDFTVTASPITVTANVGTAGTSTVTVTAVNGFNSVVSLTADNTACSITPTSVTGSGSAALSCTFTVASNIVVTVIGTSGTQSRTATVSYTIQDFTIAANPTSVTVNAGSSGTSTITVTGKNGFAGSINLGTNSTSCAITPNIVTGSGTANLSCTFASSNITHVGVTGTSGSLSHTVTVIFTSQDFSIAANPTSVAVNAGSIGTSTITITGLNGFASIVNLSSNSTACTLTPATVTGSGGASLSCNFTSVSKITVLVTGASGSLSHTTTAIYTVQDFTITVNPTSVTGNAGTTVTSTITVTGLNGLAGTISLATNSTSCTASPASLVGSGSSSLSCSFGFASIIHVTVTGTSGGLSHSATATFTLQDFTITVNPTIVTVNAGNSGTATVTVSAQNGFAGVVGFATNSTACTVSPTSVTGSGSATLSCTFASAGTIHVQVSGASSSLSHTAVVPFRVQDFAIAGNPTSVNVNVGSAGTSSTTVTAVNGFSGVVSLNTNSTSCSVTPNSVAGSGTSALSCTFSSSSTMRVAVTGTSGSLSHSVTITYIVEDFTVSASPTAVTGVASSASTSTITIAPVNGFTSSVALAVTSNSTNLSCTASPGTITGGSATSTLSCTGSLAGNYLATVTGTSSGLSHAVSITYHVQDFSIAANPPSISVTTGTKGQSTITIGPLNGFVGAVALSQNTNSTDLLCNILPTSVSGGTGTSTLSCTGSAPGNFLATVTGTSGTLSHSTAVVFAVADFAISSTSSSPVTIEASATTTIIVTALNGFTGTVSLTDTAPSGLTCGNITPATITGSGTATIACSSTTAGTYTLGVTGASGTLSHSTSATVKITDFSISATSPGAVIAGSLATSTISVNYLNGFAGTVGLTDSIPAGLNCGAISPGSLSNSGTASVSCSSNIAGTYTFGITGTSGTLSHSTTVSFVIEDFAVDANPTSLTGNVNSALTSTITISPASGFVDTVTLTFTASSTNISCNLSSTTIASGSGSSALSCTTSIPGSYTVTVKGADGLLSHTATVTLSIAVPDFSISASPATLTTNAGSPTTSTIIVSSVNGFVGIVQLSSSISPSTGLSCTLTPTSVTLGTSGTSTLSCSGSAGGYTVTVTGTPTATTPHSTTVGVTVQDFTVNATPTSVSVNAGVMGTSTVVVTNVLGFTGTVNLAATISPISGLTCSLTPTSVTLGNTGTSTLSCTGTSGTYSVTVTGTSGSLTHTATIGYTVQDFSISANPTGVTVLASASGMSTITVDSIQSLTGTVSLSATISPSTGLICNASPNSILLTNTATSGSSTLSCSGMAGSYTVTVTGSDGSLAHTTTLTYTIQDFTLAANPTSVSVPSGSSNPSTITASGLNGLIGTVSLTTLISPSTGLTCTLSQPSISLGAITSGTSDLSCTGTVGTYAVTVTGASSSLSHATTVTFIVQDFTVSANPSSVQVFSGTSGASTVTISSANGFTGTVSLTSLVSPSTGLICSLSPTSVTLTTTSPSATSTLSCTPSVTSTTFTVTVTGISGGLSRSATLTYNVGTAFTMSANPTSVTGVAGSTGSSTITVTYAPAFSGTVTLSVAVSPTSGLSCALGTTTLTSSGISTLTCSGQAGFYVVTVSGASGSNTATATVTYTVQDFALSTTSTGVTANAGSPASTTVIATGLNGFSGNVALSSNISPSNGLSCNLTPSFVSLSSTTSSATSSLSCSGTVGSYTVTVTGTGSGLTRSASVSYMVQDFSIGANPTSVSILAGLAGTSTTTVTGLQGFAGTVQLSLTTSPPTGLACTLSPTSVTLTASSTSVQSTISCSGSAGLYTVTIIGTGSGLNHSATLTFAVQDYSVSASPSTLSILAGASGSSTITVAGLQGFSGAVSLTATTSPTTGLTCAFSPLSVVLSISTSSGTATLSCSGSAGTYTITATGTSGSLAHSTTVAATVQDFALDVSTSSVIVNAGASGTSTAIISSTLGFTGTVTLASSVSPSAGLACTLTPTTVTLGTAGSSTLSCNGLAGSYLVTLTGTSGLLSHSTTVNVTVRDFTLVASPTDVTVNAGGAGTSTLSIASLQGFSGVVSLAATASPSSGLTCTLTPSSVTGSGFSTLSCTGNAGAYTVTVTGSNSGLSHSATVSYTVRDFTVSASSTSVTVLAGDDGISMITVTPLQNYAGTVSLADTIVPATGLSCAFSPVGVTLGSTGTSTLSCSGSSGVYTVTVTGTDGTLSHSQTISFTVQDFAISLNLLSVNVLAGVSGSSTTSVTPVRGFTGTIALTSTVSPATGLTCTLSPTSVTLGSSGTSTLSCNGSAGTYTVTVTGTSVNLSHSATVTYTVQDFTISANPTSVAVSVNHAGTSTITVTSVNGFTGVVSLSFASSPATGIGCTLTPTSIIGSGASTLSCSATTSGSFAVTVTGVSGTLTHGAAIVYSIAVPDFSVNANPTGVTVVAGTAGTSSITVTSINAFAGTVTLTPAVSPSAGLICTLTPGAVTLGSSGTSVLSCTGSAGRYSVNVTGTSGTLSHFAPVTYTIQDFTVSASPTSVTVNAGAPGASTISITALPALQGLTGTVTLASVVSPSTGLTCSLTPATVTLGVSGSSALSCTGMAGAYMVTVTGTSGSLSHSDTVSYTVQDFTISAGPTTVPVLAGQAATSTITLTAQQGFNALVGLTSLVTPSTGLTCNLTLTSVTGAGTSSLSCSGSVGTYTVTVTGISGGLTHSATITFTVTDFSMASSPASVTLNVGSADASTITVVPANGFAGVVNLTTNSTSCSISPTSVTGSGSPTLSCVFSSASTIHVTVTGASGTKTHATTVTYIVEDFTIAVAPATVGVTVGTAANSTLTITGLNGFVGTVTLTATPSPSTGLSCALSPSNIGGSGTSKVSCPSSGSGAFTVAVSATSGSISHSITISISVGKATPNITTSLSASSVLVGISVTDSVSMNAGFRAGGTVTYQYFAGSTCSGTPANAGTPVVVTSGTVPNSASQKFNSEGSFSWSAIYSGDSNNMGATAACEPLTVISPPVLSTPGAQTVTAGSTVHFIVNATDGSKTVTLTVSSGLPPGATFSSTQSYAGGASSIFSWTPSEAQAPGNYNVTFMARDPQGISTVSQVTIHVSAVNKAPPLPIVSYSIFGVLGFFAIVGVALLLRRFQAPRRVLRAWRALQAN